MRYRQPKKVVQARIERLAEMARLREIRAGILLEKAKELRERIEAIETGQKPHITKEKMVMQLMDIKHRKVVYEQVGKGMGKSKNWVYLAITVGADEKYRAKFTTLFDNTVRLLGYKPAQMVRSHGY